MIMCCLGISIDQMASLPRPGRGVVREGHKDGRGQGRAGQEAGASPPPSHTALPTWEATIPYSPTHLGDHHPIQGIGQGVDPVHPNPPAQTTTGWVGVLLGSLVCDVAQHSSWVGVLRGSLVCDVAQHRKVGWGCCVVIWCVMWHSIVGGAMSFMLRRIMSSCVAPCNDQIR